MSESATHLRIIEETPAYWRVVFDNPPLNIMGAAMFEGLQDLLARIDASPNLRVVVFESANPEFYIAHFELTAESLGLLKIAGPSGLPILMDAFVRLTRSPIVSIAKIRGRVRGVGSEFVLACGMRFASRENAVLAQVEVGAGVHPGGGTERLPPLVGRGRALEIILGAIDFDGATAERYGYVNRALPDSELDGFVDVLARRIASFDRRPIEAAKKSGQPGVAAIRRPAPRRAQFLYGRADMAGIAAAIPGAVQPRTQPARRNGEPVRRVARHPPRDVVIVCRCA